MVRVTAAAFELLDLTGCQDPCALSACSGAHRTSLWEGGEQLQADEREGGPGIFGMYGAGSIEACNPNLNRCDNIANQLQTRLRNSMSVA
jgi:hypothetical protein